MGEGGTAAMSNSFVNCVTEIKRARYQKFCTKRKKV